MCVATLLHGGITVVTPDARRAHHVGRPDRCVTKLCFGGRELRTVYVTLSGSGRPIAIDGGPTPGLELACGA
mgnify:FL=1